MSIYSTNLQGDKYSRTLAGTMGNHSSWAGWLGARRMAAPDSLSTFAHGKSQRGGSCRHANESAACNGRYVLTSSSIQRVWQGHRSSGESRSNLHRPQVVNGYAMIAGKNFYREDLCRSTSLIRQHPLPRTTIWPLAWGCCKGLRGGCFL